jgi:hypothetical protein
VLHLRIASDEFHWVCESHASPKRLDSDGLIFEVIMTHTRRGPQQPTLYKFRANPEKLAGLAARSYPLIHHQLWQFATC